MNLCTPPVIKCLKRVHVQFVLHTEFYRVWIQFARWTLQWVFILYGWAFLFLWVFVFCDNYLPYCWVYLSFNSRVIIDTYSYFVERKSQQSLSSWNSSQISTWENNCHIRNFCAAHQMVWWIPTPEFLINSSIISYTLAVKMFGTGGLFLK